MKKHLTTLILAIAAGFCIGIGGCVYLALLDSSKPLGAFLFTVGLFTICTFGFNLFTGKVCYLLDNKPSYLLTLLIIWVGNLIGAGGTGLLIHCSRLSESFTSAAQSLCVIKTDDSLVSLFILGAICNVLIYIGVEGYKVISNPIGKYLALVFGVMVFILIGSEHSVADMFYFAAAGYLFSPKALLSLTVITLGNAAGGLLLPAVMKLKSAFEK